jgi:hypothetical protein
MERETLEWYELLARSLLWVAGIVLLLSVIGAVVIGSSTTSVPLLEDIQGQSRGAAAIAMLGSGLTAAGLLAGLGAVLRILVVGRLEQLPRAIDAEQPGRGERDDRQEQLPLSSEPKPRVRSERKGRGDGAQRSDRSTTRSSDER